MTKTRHDVSRGDVVPFEVYGQTFYYVKLKLSLHYLNASANKIAAAALGDQWRDLNAIQAALKTFPGVYTMRMKQYRCVSDFITNSHLWPKNQVSHF